jgi:hypothetical protein
MSVALHLRGNASRISAELEELLLPDSSAVLIPSGEWVSVYAEQLSEDLADITELAAPLSEGFGEVWAHATLYYRFKDGNLEESRHDAPAGLPSGSDLEDFEAELPANALRITRDAAKPGLAEFFGRSSDE